MPLRSSRTQHIYIYENAKGSLYIDDVHLVSYDYVLCARLRRRRRRRAHVVNIITIGDGKKKRCYGYPVLSVDDDSERYRSEYGVCDGKNASIS